MNLKTILKLEFLPASKSFKALWVGSILHALDIFFAFSAGRLQRFSVLAVVLDALAEGFRRFHLEGPPTLLLVLILTSAWPLWIVLMFRHTAPRAERLWIALYLGLALIGPRLPVILFSWIRATHGFN